MALEMHGKTKVLGMTNYLLNYLSKESLISHIKACMLKLATPKNYIHNSLFKLSLTTEKYLDVINWKGHVKALARFRCSNHNLAIERQRGILSKENRICKFCKNLGRRNIDDEIHFLFECPLYHHIRCSYSIFENINPNKSSFTSVMMTRNEECLRQLGSYIYRAMHIHKEFNA